MYKEKQNETLHVSVRLPWHDRGWDGCICNDPKRNVYCGGHRSVNAERIREFIDVEEEIRLKGRHVSDIEDYLPPCTETINVFGDRETRHIHIPPVFMRGKAKIREETLQPHSSGTWPFERMWDEKGKWFPPHVRKENARMHFDSLTKDKSLIFYYCNYDNPLTIDRQRYLLVGISRLKEKYDFVFWPEIPEGLAKKYGDFIWSRILENGYPEEGVRIPYQEYLARGKKIEELEDIVVEMEEDLSRRFKYVSRILTNDDATILIEKTIRALKKVKKDGILSGLHYDWDRQIEWLDSILRECWTQRGLYPGLANTLAYCGFENPGIYIKNLSSKMQSSEVYSYVFERLEGKPLAKEEKNLYLNATERYNTLNSTAKKLCRDILPRFDLTFEQIQKILSDRRSAFGITSSLQTICGNPYCICEEYVGQDIEDRIAFYRIDNGMVPQLEEGERIQLDDPRRIRALMLKILERASAGGHSFLDRKDLFNELIQQHEKSGRKGRFLVDDAHWRQHQHFFTEKLVLDQVQGLDAIFLKRLHFGERKIRNEVLSLMKEDPLPESGLEWDLIIERKFKEQNPQARLIPEAVEEQVKALETLYRSRFCILTGGAGTGKTTVLSSFVEGVTQKDPNHEFLLLAPTGKASQIMRQKIGPNAQTIHSFLMKYDWLNAENWTFKLEGGRKCGGYNTVIIDEASMLDVELLATLFRSLNWNEIERLVFVGDPSQLPPIGPGKPFVDTLVYVGSDEERKSNFLAELTFNCRQSKGSEVVRLAAHYAQSEERPDEEVLWLLDEACGSDKKASSRDLKIFVWNDDDELLDLLRAILLDAVRDVLLKKRKRIEKIPENLTETFDLAHGLDNPLQNRQNLEAVEIIAPFRHAVSGVNNLNLFVQRLVRGDDIVRKYAKNGFVFRDKIIQVRNFRYLAYDHENARLVRNTETYVPNGAIGYVFPKRVDDRVQAKFPRDYVRYSYYLTKKQCETFVELGYVLSVHKSQGSQFTNTIFVLPDEESDFLSRELLYTALTRAEGNLYLLLQGGAHILKDRVWAGHSEILRRNSALFKTAKGIPKRFFDRFKPENLVEEALPGLMVRSKAEVRISKALADAGIPFYYEKPLLSKDKLTYRLPDFTFAYKRKTWFWEHLGRLGDPQYSKSWERKKEWYTHNGYENQLITTPIEGLSLDKSIQSVLHDKLGAI